VKGKKRRPATVAFLGEQSLAWVIGKKGQGCEGEEGLEKRSHRRKMPGKVGNTSKRKTDLPEGGGLRTGHIKRKKDKISGAEGEDKGVYKNARDSVA